MTTDKSKNLTVRLAASVLVMCTGAISSFLVLGMMFPAHPVSKQGVNIQDSRVAVKAATSRTYGLPVRLTIPKIDVNADISYMGLTASGDMEAPKTNEDSGWYKYGPHPGNTGSAVIAGHLGVGSSAVFSELGSLAKGDTISVTDDHGQIVSFVVTHTRTYAYDMEPSEVFTSATGTHLNLITCNGDWDSTKRTYSERLVVFTDRI
ncbi:MAG: class F sortase [Candidatus Saccharimonas sp.]